MSAPYGNLQTIASPDPTYPTVLKNCATFKSPPSLNAIGNLKLLSQSLLQRSIALFCSGKCPNARGWTLQDVADQSGVNYNTVKSTVKSYARREDGMNAVDLAAVQKIACAFEVAIEELIESMED